MLDNAALATLDQFSVESSSFNFFDNTEPTKWLDDYIEDKNLSSDSVTRWNKTWSDGEWDESSPTPTEGFKERMIFGDFGGFEKSTSIIVDWCLEEFSLTIRSEESTQELLKIEKTANSKEDLDLEANVRDLLKEWTNQAHNLGIYYVDAEGGIF